MERKVLLLDMLTGKGLIVAQSRSDYSPGTTRRKSKFGTDQLSTPASWWQFSISRLA
jgi:hypothetical protein